MSGPVAMLFVSFKKHCSTLFYKLWEAKEVFSMLLVVIYALLRPISENWCKNCFCLCVILEIWLMLIAAVCHRAGTQGGPIYIYLVQYRGKLGIHCLSIVIATYLKIEIVRKKNKSCVFQPYLNVCQNRSIGLWEIINMNSVCMVCMAKSCFMDVSWVYTINI